MRVEERYILPSVEDMRLVKDLGNGETCKVAETLIQEALISYDWSLGHTTHAVRPLVFWMFRGEYHVTNPKLQRRINGQIVRGEQTQFRME